MPVSGTEALLMILISTAVTFALRALPFIAFGGRESLPPMLERLAVILPPAIMAVLVVYCLKSLPGLSPLEWIPSIIAVLVVAVIHIWRKNTILSVLLGTVCYMVLLQIF